MNCISPVRITKNLSPSDYPDGLLVPCGSCISCRIAKRREWSLRLLHELSYHDDAVFLTLTYDDAHVPPNMSLRKRDLQLFMKRLRIKLDRLGIEHCIKYFACGEYGTRTKRPHYHLLLWNFPDNNKQHFPNVTSVLHFIEECWSVYSRDDDGNWLYEKGSNTPLREPIGFCMCTL